MQQEPFGSQHLEQVHESNLAGVTFAMKQALCREVAAQADAIQSAHQFTVQPGFNRSCHTHFVEPAIRVDELFGDPGFLAIRTGPDDCFELRIESNFKLLLSNEPTQRLRRVEVIDWK